MTTLIFQTVLFLLAAFVTGCLVGCWLRRGLGGGGADTSDATADDLKLLSGVGPALEKKLHALGVYRFEQIGRWSRADIARVDVELNFKGRIEREGWVSQAKVLASGGETEFSRRARKTKSSTKRKRGERRG